MSDAGTVRRACALFSLLVCLSTPPLAMAQPLSLQAHGEAWTS